MNSLLDVMAIAGGVILMWWVVCIVFTALECAPDGFYVLLFFACIAALVYRVVV